MEDIGKILKEARENLNKSFEEIHDQTRINIEHLRFLEENDFTFLPETYVKAFLKTYAMALGLDGNEILNKYLENQEEKRRAEDEVNELPSLDSKPPIPSNHNLEWSLALGALILLFSLIFVYARYKSEISENRNNKEKETPIEEVVTEEDTLNNHTQSELDKNLSSPIELEITAIEKVWVRLTIDDNKFNEYTLSTGQKLIWIAENRIEMLVGNAGGININFNRKKLGKLGDSGEAVQMIITKDGLIEKKKITNIQKLPLNSN